MFGQGLKSGLLLGNCKVNMIRESHAIFTRYMHCVRLLEVRRSSVVLCNRSVRSDTRVDSVNALKCELNPLKQFARRRRSRDLVMRLFTINGTVAAEIGREEPTQELSRCGE